AAAIEAGAPVEEILATPAFAAAFGQVIARFGHRAPAELELANPSWRADPRQLLDVVRIELHRPEHADGATAIRVEAEAELERRRSAHARCLELDLPELIEAGPGWIRPLDDEFFSARGMLPPAKSEDVTDKLTGIAASPGVVTAMARVLLDPTDDFEPG